MLPTTYGHHRWHPNAGGWNGDVQWRRCGRGARMALPPTVAPLALPSPRPAVASGPRTGSGIVLIQGLVRVSDISWHLPVLFVPSSYGRGSGTGRSMYSGQGQHHQPVAQPDPIGACCRPPASGRVPTQSHWQARQCRDDASARRWMSLLVPGWLGVTGMCDGKLPCGSLTARSGLWGDNRARRKTQPGNEAVFGSCGAPGIDHEMVDQMQHRRSAPASLAKQRGRPTRSGRSV